METFLLGWLNLEIILLFLFIPCAICMKYAKENNKTIIKVLSISNIATFIFISLMHLVNSNLLITASKIFPW